MPLACAGKPFPLGVSPLLTIEETEELVSNLTEKDLVDMDDMKIGTIPLGEESARPACVAHQPLLWRGAAVPCASAVALQVQA